MQPRKDLLPPYQQHFLDGALESFEMTSAASMAIRLYGDPADVDAVAAGLFGAGLWRGIAARREHALGIENYGLSLVRRLPAKRRGALAVVGMMSILRHINELDWILCDWNFKDSTQGGALKPYLRRVKLDRKERPTKRVMRRLESPRAIHRFVSAALEVRHLRRLCSGLACLDVAEADLTDWHSEWAKILDDLEDQLAFHRLQTLLIRDEDAGLPRPDVSVDALYGFWGIANSTSLSAIAKRKRKASRRRVIRAAAFVSALLGTSAVSAFARGEPVTIDCDGFRLNIARGNSIAAAGHGAIRVAVHDTDGARLANLCIYQNGTPALDQLATLAMHAQVGEAQKVLDTGNLFDIEPTAILHPIISARRPPAIDPVAPPAPMEFVRRDGAFYDHMAEYRRRFTPAYRASMTGLVFGRASKHPAARVAIDAVDQQRASAAGAGAPINIENPGDVACT